MADLAPQQWFRDDEGRLWMYVRTGPRPSGDICHFWATTQQRAIFTCWTPLEQDVAGELVNDTLGRDEAVTARRELAEASRERDALLKVMAEAVKHVPSATAEELREIYRRQLALA